LQSDLLRFGIINELDNDYIIKLSDCIGHVVQYFDIHLISQLFKIWGILNSMDKKVIAAAEICDAVFENESHCYCSIALEVGGFKAICCFE